MKAILSLLLLIFLSTELWSKHLNYPEQYNMPVLFDGSKLKGVKPIMGNYLYMAEVELSNSKYCSFLQWLQKNSPNLYSENLPDTSVWSKVSEGMVKSYLRNPAFGHFPVCGITQKQAQNYCLWLHDRLAEEFVLNTSPIKKFIVRLPSEKEWILAAKAGIENAIYPWDHDGIRYQSTDKKHAGKLLMNCRLGMHSVANLQPYEMLITTETYSYWPNAYGLYNMAGNVAEWVEEKNISKGGSWKLPPFNCRIDQRINAVGLDPRSADIGFRYVVEICNVEDKTVSTGFEFSSNLFKKEFMYIPSSSDTKQWRYMSNEITNEWFQQFLKEVNDTNYCINPSIWKPYFRYSYFEQYGWHSAFKNYPVVGISYEAANAFCDWLSRKYLSNPKRQFKKIRFRLPSETEWMDAAYAGKTSSYPWPGPFARNSKGCFLANFSPNLEASFYQDSTGFLSWYAYDNIKSKVSDGLMIPGNFKTYFPNDYGLYNFSGNVAEMINEKGISKGGSWLSDEFAIMIISKEKYTYPSAALGFRVLAEVIEK